MASNNVIQLQSRLAEKFPGLRLGLDERPALQENFRTTGLPRLDEALGGGLIRGALNEIDGSGSATLIHHMLHHNARENGSVVRIAGQVVCRQRPGTAKGFVFVSLEDETGISNAVVTLPMFEDNRLIITQEPFLIIEGRVQHSDNVIHIKAEKFERLEHALCDMPKSYDFR